jgi:hypothetical protein
MGERTPRGTESFSMLAAFARFDNYEYRKRQRRSREITHLSVLFRNV